MVGVVVTILASMRPLHVLCHSPSAFSVRQVGEAIAAFGGSVDPLVLEAMVSVAVADGWCEWADGGLLVGMLS